MASYSFTYSDAAGALIRSTAMQCGSDAEAIAQAHATMLDPFATLVILDEDRVVFSRTRVTS